jgi:hypothetical protein
VTVLTDPARSTGTPDPSDSTRLLAATLEPDGSISLLIRFPDSDAPVTASIDPIETTIQAAGPVRRPVELRPGHAADRLLRLVIAMHVDALAYERRQQHHLPPVRLPDRLSARNPSPSHRRYPFHRCVTVLR